MHRINLKARHAELLETPGRPKHHALRGETEWPWVGNWLKRSMISSSHD
jgi:hypothetical protein